MKIYFVETIILDLKQRFYNLLKENDSLSISKFNELPKVKELINTIETLENLYLPTNNKTEHSDNNDWIFVKDKLPELNVYVETICSYSETIFIDKFIGSGWVNQVGELIPLEVNIIKWRYIK